MKASHDGVAGHAGFNPFQSHPAADGVQLLREVDHAATALPDRTDHAVVADDGTGWKGRIERENEVGMEWFSVGLVKAKQSLQLHAEFG